MPFIATQGQEATLSIPELAKTISKTPVKRTLPNGKEVEQIVWEGTDLETISRILHNCSGELPEHVRIDGPMPAWMAAALVHEIHPRSASLNSPDGFVPVGMQRPSGNGLGENLKWRVAEHEGWHVVHVQQDDPSVPLDPKKLDAAAPPELPMGAKVVVSGRIPNWLAASIGMAYHGRAKAVAFYQPGVGATVAITHSPDVKLGSVVPEEIVREALNKATVDSLLSKANNAQGIRL